MKYIIPLFDCNLISDKTYELCANVKYSVENVENSKLFLTDKNYNNLKILDFNIKNANHIVKHKNNTYYFLFPFYENVNQTIEINYKMEKVFVSLSKKLSITKNGKVLFYDNVEGVEYSHYEMVGDLCIIHFCGIRKFIAIIKGEELCCASFYDEYNKNGEEQFFMCKLFDGLNHGKVFHIKDNKFDSYLVYLDDYDLNLKEDFLCFIFLDCVKAGNYKYCSNLLSEELCNCGEDVYNFFGKFDYFYPFSKTEIALFKKNTLSGIFKFEIINNKISNIIPLD